uniref:Hypothetical conserved protein n=2 Tax=Candidatus Bipolaricaulota TaxID=67810 RepID=H5S9W7_9BACT|nr:hypothetical conserved protein [uncultured Acetothermia bacterium]BAL59221.1 hypothetical conserved protein [Candidatus Acetothermum autotrophicum]
MLSTFSIVACDLKAGEWGVAAQSKFLAVGAVVPWAEARVGAIATQAYANTSYGPRGLAMMKLGFSAEETLKKLVETDAGREHRQLGIVDAQGRAAAFTGKECYPWAGHIVGKNFAVQGNILVSQETVEAMAEAFERTRGPLWKRLLESLRAGQRAGGDRRGQQSAAIVVVKEKGGYGEFTDRMIDLRVDDHPQPIEELARLLDLRELYFGRTKKRIKLDAPTTQKVQTMLKALGYYKGAAHGKLDKATIQALIDFHNTENLEMRLQKDLQFLDARVLRFLEEKAKLL